MEITGAGERRLVKNRGLENSDKVQCIWAGQGKRQWGIQNSRSAGIGRSTGMGWGRSASKGRSAGRGRSGGMGRSAASQVHMQVHRHLGT